jgi:K+-sensing histidine kinase KdpD
VCESGAKDIKITIKNNGKGIAANKLEVINRVFENPMSAETTQLYKMGLGISLIGKFVKRNRGVVTATTEPGVGSCFELTLPRAPRVMSNSVSLK